MYHTLCLHNLQDKNQKFQEESELEEGDSEYGDEVDSSSLRDEFLSSSPPETGHVASDPEDGATPDEEQPAE